MKLNREIVTLCGSTRFMQQFREIEKQLALEGKITLLPAVFGKSENVIVNSELKEKFDELHKDKIELADSIFVIDVDGYIGESTRSEIDYALKQNKIVKYYSKEQK